MKPCRPDCQCPNCDPEMRAIMRMNPRQYSGWLTLRTAQHAKALGLRTAVVPDDTDTDTQLKSMSAFRDQVYGFASTTRMAATTPATSEAHLQPPDPYEPHLERRRRELL